MTTCVKNISPVRCNREQLVDWPAGHIRWADVNQLPLKLG